MRGLLVWVIVVLAGWSGVRAAYVVGSRLPREHRASASGVVAAPPERVWGLLTETLAQAQWRTGVTRVQTQDPQWSGGLVCWTEWRPQMAIPLCLEEEQAGVRRVVKTHDWAPMPFEARWTYELAPVAGGTQVTIVEESSISKPLWRFYGRYLLRGRTEAAQELKDLQAEGPRIR